MNEKTTQGQSRATIDKERRIGSLLKISMQIAASKFGGGRWNYFHFDANAGSGWNEVVDVPGSPRVFWDLADRHLANMPFHAFFAERSASRAHALLRAVPGRPPQRSGSYVFARDNEEVLAVFAQFIRDHDRPAYAVGTVIVDPNGWFYRNSHSEGAPVTGLYEFAKEFPKIDIALNLNARTYRLQRGDGQCVQGPEEVMRGLGKAHWLVSHATYGGNNYFLAIGRNTVTGDHKALGMYDLKSEQGRYIINLVEGRRQRTLFDAFDAAI
jgi:hypothetical protein